MRGIYSSVTEIRSQVFTVSKYRDSIFLERAIVGERLRLSMGLPLRPIDEHAPLSTGIEEAARPEKYY